ncbi:MAG: hypothetical protein ACI9BW_002857 [Gammaproteobacteria bacterium]|jgi:hypothetical protein
MRLQDNTHYLLLVWLVITGLSLFGVVVSWNEGLIDQLVDGDQSRICLVIALLYSIGTIHCATRALFLSTELNHAELIAAQLSSSKRLGSVSLEGGELVIGGSGPLPGSVMARHLADVVISNRDSGGAEVSSDNANLVDALAERLKGAHELGWFGVDMLLKLGLVGTIIGFVMMLASVTDTDTFDVTTMQKILRNMSSGMGTALYTTLAGLVGSILLGLQYLVLDKGADELLHRVIRATELQVKPRINGSEVN